MHSQSSPIEQKFKMLTAGERPERIDVRFNTENIQKMIEAFQFIPSDVTTLDFRTNVLGEMDPDLIIKFFAAIPKQITTLHLGANCLKYLSASNLARVLHSLPPQIRKLFLGRNDLNLRNSDEIKSILQSIPAGVTHLSLDDNSFHSRSCDQLINLFEAFPATVRSLDFSGNYFYMRPTDEIVRIFSKLPEHLEDLDLSGCGLGRTLQSKSRPLSDIVNIIHAIPATMRKVVLAYNGLDELSLEDATKLVTLLAHNDEHTLEFDIEFINKFVDIEALMPMMDALILEEHHFGPMFENMNVSEIIYQYRTMVPCVVSMLSEENSPRAMLLCGLLLEGRALDKSKLNGKTHFLNDQTLMQAIDYYERALAFEGNSEQFKEAIQFILAEIKRTTPNPQIREKIDQLIDYESISQKIPSFNLFQRVDHTANDKEDPVKDEKKGLI